MFYRVSKERFYKAKNSNELFEKTQNFLKPYYFAIQKSNLKGNKVRKLYHFTNETIRQIERKYYAQLVQI